MSRRPSVIALLLFVTLALVVAPTVALCATMDESCCCGPHAKPSDPCPTECAFEAPESSPQTTPETVKTVQPLFVVVAQVDGFQMSAPVAHTLPTIAGIADEFPNDSLLSRSDATRAPPLAA